jgi:Holliday junction resolvase-like predicted endonuclease
MEPEVHIIEKYFQEILHCFTMTNIRCKGGKEIDLLAINPKTLERYHVKSRVSTTFKLKLKATYSKKGRCYKNGIDYFAKEN